MQKVILIAIALFLMVSCSDDSSPITNNNDGVLLKRKVETEADGTINSTVYSYDGNKITTMCLTEGDGDIVLANYTYSSGELTPINYLWNSELKLKTVFSYNSSGKLASSIQYGYYDLGTPHISAQKFIFNYGSGTTIASEIFGGDENSQTEHLADAVVRFNNGNITAYSLPGFESVYTYDNRNNPLKNVFAMDVINLDQQFGGPNNIVTYHSEGNSYTSTYTYNAKNYPTSSIDNFNGDLFTTQYFYE